MSDKKFTTIEEQLAILESRRLSIPDKSGAYEFLLYNNYYSVSGYSLTLRDFDIFHSNTSFQNIMDIYNFDHKLRHILLEYIEVIEVSFKLVYSYEFTKRYGAIGHLNSDFFTDKYKHKEIIEKAK